MLCWRGISISSLRVLAVHKCAEATIASFTGLARKGALWALAGILLAHLAGCAAPSGGMLQPERVSQLRRIGVVSVAGASLYREYLGFTVFTNESEVADISSWRLTETWEAQLQTAAARATRFEVVRVDCDRRRLTGLDEPGWTVETRTPPVARQEGVAEAVRCAGAAGVDALLVAVDSPEGGTNRDWYGATLWGHHVNSGVGVGAELLLLDARSAEPLARMRLREPSEHAEVQQQFPLVVPIRNLRLPVEGQAKLAGSSQTIGNSGISVDEMPTYRRVADHKVSELDDATVADLRAAFQALPQFAWEPSIKLLLKAHDPATP
jgi:hypothetical protein